jgi:hypothetical protein
MRLFGVTVAPVPEADPPDRDPSPNPPLAAREDVMRKCKSMSNLAAAGASVEGNGATDGYLSDDGLMQSSGKRRRLQERKKGVAFCSFILPETFLLMTGCVEIRQDLPMDSLISVVEMHCLVAACLDVERCDIY